MRILYILLLTLPFSCSALAGKVINKPYVGIGLGGSFSAKAGADYDSKTLGNSPVLRANIGAFVAKKFALELDLSYRAALHYANTLNNYSYSQDFKVVALGVNGALYFGRHNSITPYATLGVGFAYLKPAYIYKTSLADKSSYYQTYKNLSKKNATWLAGAGVEFKVEEGAFFKVGYKYQDFGNATTNTYTSAAITGAAATTPPSIPVPDVYRASIKAQEIEAGFRFEF